MGAKYQGAPRGELNNGCCPFFILAHVSYGSLLDRAAHILIRGWK